MFKDKLLVGQYDYFIDGKSRLSLPSRSEREPGDHVFLVYDSVLDQHELYSPAAIEKKFDVLNDLILSANTDEEKKKYKLLYLDFCKSILKDCVVDCQNRILLTPFVTPCENVKLIGANDHLILERVKKNQ